MNKELIEAAQAVVDRWDSIDWKLPPTADYIARLRAALAAVNIIADIISITPADADMLAELMDNPPPPNEALNQAFERHQAAKRPPMPILTDAQLWHAAYTAGEANTAMAVAVKHDALQLAVDRLEDMLKGDDGQAWQEAERALPRLRAALELPLPELTYHGGTINPTIKRPGEGA